ncbi:hypothetical protein [Azorhizobium sp. AG788]|uniref:hypothetical protein n=1 Tax=Azorhizobium sp. AG788 TaxID=2183897 RepID=UPI003139E975
MNTVARKIAVVPRGRVPYAPIPAVSPRKPYFFRRFAVLLAFIAVGGFFYALTQVRTVADDRRLANAHTADEIVRIILGDSARLAVVNDTRSISIHYDLSPWSITRSSLRSSYIGNVMRLVPILFERVPESAQVEVVADNIFATIQGREVRQPAFSLLFTRATAAKVDWAKVSPFEVIRGADRAWATPSMGWQ